MSEDSLERAPWQDEVKKLADLEMVWRVVEKYAKSRHDAGNLKTLDDEINFALGAMAAITAMTGEMYSGGAIWLYVGGRSAFDIEYKYQRGRDRYTSEYAKERRGAARRRLEEERKRAKD